MPLISSEMMSLLNKEYYEVATGRIFWELVDGRVKKCIADPETHRNDPVTVLSAFCQWKSQPDHQCYWNNRFVIAVMCNMSPSQKLTSAWAFICNCHSGYFEWVTHSGYKVEDVFRYLGIQGVNPPDTPGFYSHLSKHIIDQIADIFDLPTTTYGSKNRLTPEEDRKRERLNKLNKTFDLM